MVAEPIPAQEAVVNVKISLLVPRAHQHRQHFDDEKTRQLADSMLASGFLTFLTVRPASSCQGYAIPGGHFEIVAGHRRHRAAQLAGLPEIPCVVKHLTDAQALELELLDNLNNEHPLPWEEGNGYAALVADVGLSPEAVAQKAGKTVATVKDRMTIAVAAAGPHGEKLTTAYLNRRISLYALSEVAKLPPVQLAPKRCPGCAAVCPETAQSCPACQSDLREVFAFNAGCPQDAALRLLCNGAAKDNPAVAQVIEQVKQSYGLSRQVVQTSLGFNDVQITQAAVQVKTTADRMMEAIGKLGDWILKPENEKEVRHYTAPQKAALNQQIVAARTVLARLEQAAS